MCVRACVCVRVYACVCVCVCVCRDTLPDVIKIAGIELEFAA